MPKPDNLSALAVTDKGRMIRHTYHDVELALRLLVLRGGQPGEVSQILAEQNIEITAATLRHWRNIAFATRFIELQAEMIGEVSEEVAARAMERAIQADDAEALYIEAARDKLDEVSPDKLAASVLSLAKAKAENISKAQLLRDRPTEIRGTADTSELLEVLRRNGVLAHDPRTHEQIIDAEVVEEPDEDLRKRIKAKLSTNPVRPAGSSGP